MYKFIKIAATLSIPMLFNLSFIAFLVGAVWLLFGGLWKVVLGACIVSVIVFKLYMIIMFPIDIIFVPLLTYFAENQKKWPATITCFFTLIIHYVIFLVWAILVVCYAVMLSEINSISPLPFLLLGWFVATAAFSFVASKEDTSNAGSFMGLFFLHIVYLTLTLLLLIDGLWVSVPLLILLLLLFVIPGISDHIEELLETRL